MPEENCLPTLQPVASRLWSWAAVVLLLLLILPACTTLIPLATQAPLDLVGIFPPASTVPGWAIFQKGELYQHDNLFNLVDGQADSFFAYGFEAVAVQRYQAGPGVLLNVEIWQLATPADAYGLFSAGRSGSPAAIGNAGDTDPGRRLAFWQNRYFVSLNATQPVPDETLQIFASSIAGGLPAGGETPAIVSRLPGERLVERQVIFFHEEMSIQMEVWLGGENLLELGPQTNGVLAHYMLGDISSRLLLIEYPTSAQADRGLKALQSSRISGLAASDARGNILGAVFGRADAARAQALLQDALK